MLQLKFQATRERTLNILCLGAHSDDIEIGAGGTILTLLHRYPGATVHWIVFAAQGERASEATSSAQAFLAQAGSSKIDLHEFRDGFFPDQFCSLKAMFENIKNQFQPDLIISHYRNDHHQDHRTIAELTWNTFRDHLILGYEILKYDPDMGNPNFFVSLDDETAQSKVELLIQHFTTQRQRRWFTKETFAGMMRVRGVQAGAPSGLAEAFYAPKLVF